MSERDSGLGALSKETVPFCSPRIREILPLFSVATLPPTSWFPRGELHRVSPRLALGLALSLRPGNCFSGFYLFTAIATFSPANFMPSRPSLNMATTQTIAIAWLKKYLWDRLDRPDKYDSVNVLKDVRSRLEKKAKLETPPPSVCILPQ